MNATKTVLIERSRLTVPAIDVVVRTTDGKRRSHRLGVVPVVVGTDPSADLSIKDPAVSRKHCTLALTEKGIRVCDLGSKNGTYYQNVRIADAYVPTSALVALSAETQLSFSDLDAPPTVIPLSLNVKFGEAIGGSDAMRALFSVLERAAATDETILLLGESGTGKELLARGIHEGSPRKSGPLVTVDCGGISPSLIESELFGHVRGAFTGAVGDRTGALGAANGGTLFLDEIGELPLDLQPKLLRALEARTYQPVGSTKSVKFDARIIAATHRDLLVAKNEGLFREDLYFRLAVVQARVPPLRERKQDLEFLAERFLGQLIPPKRLSDLSPTALSMLRQHDFPGNVRELKNVVIRLALFPELLEEAFERTLGSKREAKRDILEFLDLPLREARDQIVSEFERKYVQAKLEQNAGNVSRTATSMGVSRQFLHRVMAEYGIKGKGNE